MHFQEDVDYKHSAPAVRVLDLFVQFAHLSCLIATDGLRIWIKGLGFNSSGLRSGSNGDLWVRG